MGHRSTKVCIKLDGRALASVWVARGLESVLWVGSEFVVLVFSVVRHVDINLLARYNRSAIGLCNQGVGGGEFGAHQRSQVGQGGRLGRAIPCWKGGVPKTFSDALGAYTRAQPRKGELPQVHLRPRS